MTLELFEGENYIYLLDVYNNEMYAEYLVKSNINEIYATRVELNTAITQTSESITLTVDKKINDAKEELNSTITQTAEGINTEVSKKVGKTEIISSINQSAETVAINANKIKLEGYTTINGGFSVDENGNASIANDTVVINENGVNLKTGARVIGGDGVLTNFQYIFKSTHPYGEIGDFGDLGFFCVMGANNYKSSLIADVYIPTNFTITEAKVILYHAPIYYNDISAYGYARALKIYKSGDMTNLCKYVDSVQGTDISGMTDGLGYSEITNGLGVASYTPTAPTSSSHVMETRTGIDIKSYLSTGNNRLKIESSNSIPSTTTFETCAKQTGFCKAIINVIGYTKN